MARRADVEKRMLMLLEFFKVIKGYMSCQRVKHRELLKKVEEMAVINVTKGREEEATVSSGSGDRWQRY